MRKQLRNKRIAICNTRTYLKKTRNNKLIERGKPQQQLG